MIPKNHMVRLSGWLSFILLSSAQVFAGSENPDMQGKHTSSAQKKQRVKTKASTRPQSLKKKIKQKHSVKKASKNKNLQVKEVVVRPENEDIAAQKDVSGFVTVIRTQKAKQNINSLSQILKRNTGVHIRSLGGLGSWSSLSIRGSSSNQVQVLLDGIPLNHGGSGVVNLSDLPLFSISSLEIYRGFAPSHLSGALGGALQLNTEIQKNKRLLGFQVGFGSFLTKLATFAYAQSFKKWQWQLYTKYWGAKGDFQYFDDRGTPLNTEDDQHSAHRQNNYFDNASVFASIRYQATSRLKIKVSNLLNLRVQGIPGIDHFRSQSATYQNRKNYLQVAFQQRAFPFIASHWKNQFYWLQQAEQYDDPNGEIGIARQKAHYQTNLLGWKSHLLWFPAISHELDLAIQLRRENWKAKDQLAPTSQTQTHATRWQLTPSLQYTLSLLEQKLLFISSGRLTLLNQNSLTKAKKQPETVRDWLPNARIGLKYKIIKQLALQGNAGYYHRFPTFWELFGDRGTTIGNPNLSPESGILTDVGFQLQIKKPFQWMDRLFIAYAFFGTRTKSLIRYIQNAQRTMLAINIDQAQIYGHEVRLRLSLFHWFKVKADFTWMNAVNQSPAPEEFEKRLPGRPEQSLSLQFIFSKNGFDFSYDILWVQGNYLDRANLHQLPERHIHNIQLLLPLTTLARAIGYRAHWDGLSLAISCKNLLNNQIEQMPLNPPLPGKTHVSQAISDFNGYPLPGRRFAFTVSWKFN